MAGARKCAANSLRAGNRAGRIISMQSSSLRSPYEKIAGLVYVGRMLDKIRLHRAQQLLADYVPNLGIGLDRQACLFLAIDYPALVERVGQGGTDEEIVEWCMARWHRPREQDIAIWNEFMRKFGWYDKAAPRLRQRIAESKLEGRSDIFTLFDQIEVDEGRESKWEQRTSAA